MLKDKYFVFFIFLFIVVTSFSCASALSWYANFTYVIGSSNYSNFSNYSDFANYSNLANYSAFCNYSYFYNELDPLWTANYSDYNSTWTSTYNTTYDAYNSSGLIINWSDVAIDWNASGLILDYNGTGLIINWSVVIGDLNSTGLIKDWNNTGMIINWNNTGYLINWTDVAVDYNSSGLILNWSEVIGDLNSSGIIIDWYPIMLNGTLMLVSNWNATNTSYYLASNPNGYYNSTSNLNNVSWTDVMNGTVVADRTTWAMITNGTAALWSQVMNGTIISGLATWANVVNGTIWSQMNNGTLWGQTNNGTIWSQVVNGTIWSQVVNGSVVKANDAICWANRTGCPSASVAEHQQFPVGRTTSRQFGMYIPSDITAIAFSSFGIIGNASGVGTGASIPLADGYYINYTSAATINIGAGINSTKAITQTKWLPYLRADIRTDTNITGRRIWFGLEPNASVTSVLLTWNGTNNLTGYNYTGIRWDTSSTDFPAHWACCSGNGTATAVSNTCINTTVAVSQSTSYALELTQYDLGTLECAVTVNETTRTAVNKTGQLDPVGTQNMALILKLTTLSAGARSWLIQDVYFDRT